MAVIIGAATQITGFEGVVSVNWNMSPNVRRLWEIGSYDPYDSMLNVINTINVTCYGGGGPTITIPRATDCVDSTAVFECTVIPAACGDNVPGPTGTFYLNSYTFNKGDVTGPGQTSYAGQQWASDPHPSYVLCGGAEGTAGGNARHGVVFSTIDATGIQGSVSAGFPGLGTSNEINYGVVLTVGDNPSSIDHGKTGTANVTIKHQPIWLGT